MNSLYIGVGVAVILALVTALVGPLFVDWGTHRALFEAEASRIVGLPVKVLGDVDARLIPAPRVRFGDVVIGDLAHPIARVGRFELDLDVAGLIRGETRVSDLVLDRPALDLALDADGRLEGLPHRAADLSAVRIETVRFVDGRATFTDRRSKTTWGATGIAGTGAVESLAGSWRLEAKGLVDKRAVELRLASRRGAEGPRLRITATVAAGPSLGGDLTIGGDAARPTLSGPVTLERAADGATPAVKLAGRLDLDAAAARLDDLTVTIGEAPDGASFAGTARATFGAESATEVALRTARLDLGGGPGGARARLVGLADDAREATAGLSPPKRTRLTLEIDTAAIAGGLVSEVSAEVATRPGGFTIERARARLPGEGEVSLSGRLDLADRVLDGDGSLAAVAPETLSAWWTGETAGESRIGEVSLAGAFTLTRDGFSGPDLALRLGATEARGRVESRADGLVRLGLSAARLDGERFAALLARLSRSRSIGEAAGLDLDFDVDRLDFGAIAARGARLSLHASDGAVAIDRLALADLAGARVSASGRIADLAGAPNGRIEATIVADRPGPAARVLGDLLFPGSGRTAEAIGAAAGPLDLALSLSGGALSGGTAPAGGSPGDAGRLEATAKGRAAGGTLDLEARWSGRLADLAHGRLDGRLGLDGAKLSAVAARLLEARAEDRVILSGRVAGRPVDGLDFAFEAGLGDRRASAAGKITMPDGGLPRASLHGRLAAPDLGLLAVLAGDPLTAVERRLPVDVEADVEGWGTVWTASRFAGAIAETRVAGSGRLDASGRRPRLEGDVRLDRADLATLTGVALAAPVDFALATRIDRLELPGDRIATAVAARVAGDEGGARASEFSAGLGAVRLAGDLRARRAGAATAVAGRLDGTIDGFATAAEAGRPVLSGRLSADLAFEAQGKDLATAIRAAAGSGRLRLDGGRLDRVGLAGLRAPRDGEGSAETLVAAMAGAAIALPPLDLPLLLDKARLQVPPTGFDVGEGAARGRGTGRAAGDLLADRLDGVVTLEPSGEDAPARATAVSHAMPSLDLALSGSFEAPRLGVDPAGLAAFLTLHHVEREIEAAETQRQDRIERRRFSTILDRIERRRRAREAPVDAVPVPPPAAVPQASETRPIPPGGPASGTP